MIDAMPRPRPPHLHREENRHGTPVWYVRVGKGPRIRIREAPGTPAFDAAYQAAIRGETLPGPQKAAKGSLKWLYDQYRDTGGWKGLSAATRRQREYIFDDVLKENGTAPAHMVTTQHVKAGIDRRWNTPSQARHFLDALRGMFEWAVAAEHISIEPTKGVAPPPRPKSDGFPAWTEEHVAMYQAHWALGTRQRVWLDVLLYSGLRRGDAVRYGRQHVRGGVGRIKTEKSRFELTVTVPVLPVLQETLDAGPVGDMTFIVGVNGTPLTKETFGNEFRDACRAAGVPGSAHGVRKIAATTAANNGATVAQLKALFGWDTDAMPALYTRTADRERLGRDAGHMLANKERNSIPAPKEKVRASSRKSKQKQGLTK